MDPTPHSTLQIDPRLRRVLLTIGYMVIVAGFVYAFAMVWPALRGLLKAVAPFIVALVVAYLFNPIVNVAERKLRITRVGGVIVVNLLIFLIVGIFVAIIVPILSTQIKSAYHGVRDISTRKVVPWVNRQVMGDARPLEPKTVREIEKAFEAELAHGNFPLPKATVTGRVDTLAADAADDPPRKEELRRAALQFASWLELQPDPVPADVLRGKLAVLETESRAGVSSWTTLQGRAIGYLERLNIDIDQLAGRALSSSDLRNAATSAASEGAGLVGRAVAWVGAFIVGLVNSVFFLVFVFLVSFYLLIDFAALRGVAEIMVPDRHQPRFFDVMAKVDIAVGGFIRGQITSAILVGILTFVGLMALGLKQYALLIGCIAAIGNLIPYLGPVMGATPAVLYMLFSGTHDTMQDKLIYSGLVVALFGLIQAIDGFVFQPKIVGKGAQLHPVAVMLALVLGSKLGIVGMIVAVPVACILRVLLKEFYWDRREEAWHERTGKEDLGEFGTPPPRKKKKKRG